MIREIITIEIERETLYLTGDEIEVVIEISGVLKQNGLVTIETARIKRIEIYNKLVKNKLHNFVFNKLNDLKITVINENELKIINKHEWLCEIMYEYEFNRLKEIAEEVMDNEDWTQMSGIDRPYYYFRKHSDNVGTILSDYMVLKVVKNSEGKIEAQVLSKKGEK